MKPTATQQLPAPRSRQWKMLIRFLPPFPLSFSLPPSPLLHLSLSMFVSVTSFPPFMKSFLEALRQWPFYIPQHNRCAPHPHTCYHTLRIPNMQGKTLVGLLFLHSAASLAQPQVRRKKRVGKCNYLELPTADANYRLIR